MVRQRSKAGQGKAKRSLIRKDSTSSLTENFTLKEEGEVSFCSMFIPVYTLI